MATEVLRPQDCLVQGIRVPPTTSFSRRKIPPSHYYYANFGSACNYSYYYNNNNNDNNGFVFSNPNPNPRSSRRSSRRSSSADDLRAPGATERVAILRRGESLDSKIKSEALRQNFQGGPSGDGGVYAGSAFAVSPSPSSLPLPSFSRKKLADSTAVDDSATRDLRRLLRIA